VVDVVEPGSAFGAVLATFRSAARLVLELREVAHSRIVELAEPRAGPPLDAMLGTFQIQRLPDVGAIRSAGGSFLLGTGFGRWLLIVEEKAADTARTLEHVADAFDIALEAADAWTQFAISGSAALDLLAKGCALDLHPRVFSKDVCATTRFAQARCVLFRAANSHRLLVGRSYAVSLAEWLVEAAEEFGLAMGSKVTEEAPSSETRLQSTKQRRGAQNASNTTDPRHRSHGFRHHAR
jgi:sarcosine oxidase, subunit gamma